MFLGLTVWSKTKEMENNDNTDNITDECPAPPAYYALFNTETSLCPPEIVSVELSKTQYNGVVSAACNPKQLRYRPEFDYKAGLKRY